MKFMHKTLGEGYQFMIFSVVSTFVAWLVFKILDSFKNSYGIFQWAIDHQDKVYIFLLGTFLVGSALSFLGRRLKSVWNGTLKKAVNDEVEAFKASLSFSLDLQKMKECIDTISTDEVKNSVPQVYSRIYGKHCLRENSLRHFIQERIDAYYHEKKPHRSSYTRNVKLVELMGKDDFFLWDEVCSYKVHSVFHDNNYEHDARLDKGEETTFLVEYFARTNVGVINCLKDLNPYCIRILFDGKEVFNSSAKISYDDGKIQSLDDDFKVLYFPETKEIEFRYKKIFPIEKSMTDVEIHEKSLISKDDNHYSVRSSSPVCGAELQFSIPLGWELSDSWITDEDSWRRIKNESTMVYAKTDEWLLPGMLFYCTWLKKAG